MTSDRFIDWLNGFFEISGAKELNERELSIIKDKLSLVNIDNSNIKNNDVFTPSNSGNIQLLYDNHNISHTADGFSPDSVDNKKPYRGPLQS